MNEPDIIFFGGTFDPPHAGHSDCISMALERFPNAKMLVVPAKIPATAGSGKKLPGTDFGTRIELCKLEFDLFSDRLTISELEATLPTPNYSISTITELKKKFPGQRIAMMIGMDQFENFLSWRSPREILTAADLIVVSRTSGKPSETDGRFERAQAKLLQEFGASFFEKSGKIHYLEELTAPASSTELRSLFENQSKIPESWLTPAVETYIKDHNIYQNKDRQ